MTYSIVARDGETGQLGVAAQSHFFGVGKTVVWAEGGVGAVATQAFAEPSYGVRALKLLGDGDSPSAALSSLLSGDAAAPLRQLAVIDKDGEVAVHSGSKCWPIAGHVPGRGVAVQGNMLAGEAVLWAMHEAFQQSDGDLAARLLFALEAGEAEGGDIRGSQSAAMLIVPGERGDALSSAGAIVDVRVEDHTDPLGELRRLIDLDRWYTRFTEVWKEPGLLMAGPARMDAIQQALDHLGRGQSLLGENQEATFWRGLLYARVGQRNEARVELERAIAVRPQLRDLLRRLVKDEVLPDQSALLEEVIAELAPVEDERA